MDWLPRIVLRVTVEDPPLFTTAAWACANWFPFAVVELFAISDRSMFSVPLDCAMAAPAAMA